MLTLVAVLVTTAVRGLGSNSSDKFEGAHQGIANGAATTAAGGAGGGGGGGGGGGATTTAAPTATVVPTTTAATTTAATTTTTASTTTVAPTTTMLPSGLVELSAATANAVSSSKWTASTTMTVKTTDGGAIPNAVVMFTVRSWKGSTFTDTTATATTASNGKVSYTTAQQQRSGVNAITKVEIIVTDVAPPNGYTWDGAKPSTSVNKP